VPLTRLKDKESKLDLLKGFFFLIYLFLKIIFSCTGSLLLLELFSRGYSSCGAQASHCGGLSCTAWALEHEGFSSYGSRALEHRLNSCGEWA